MNAVDNPLEIMTVASVILVLLLNCQRALILEASNEEEDDFVDDPFPACTASPSLLDVQDVSSAALHQWTLWNSLSAVDEELGFWMKPRSTAWFSKFLLEEYDDSRWINIFRMTKRSLVSLSTLITPIVRRRDTNFRDAIPVIIRLGCTLFKLCQGASLLICSELFAVGRSTVSIMLRDVVSALNLALREEIRWPMGDSVQAIADDFHRLCGLPAVLGAIDVTHLAIAKPRFGPSDYYHFRSGGYTMTCQVVVDSTKRILDVNVGMPGSTNDARVLRRSALFHRGQHGILWEGGQRIRGFSPFLIGDAGYPTLPWLMAPHHHHSSLSLSQRLFNRKLSKGRAVVENAFAMLKSNFRELNRKSDLHVTFLPDVVVVCAMMHNVLLRASHEEVERHFIDMAAAGLRHGDQLRQSTRASAAIVGPVENTAAVGRQTREELGVYLSLQRIALY